MTITPDDEREAREWANAVLERAKAERFALSPGALAAARTILALLDAPRMPRPEDVPPHVLEKMLRVYFMRREEATDFDDMRAAYRALYDHYTAPPQKVEAWALVDSGKTKSPTIFSIKENAEACAERYGGRVVRLVEARDE